MSAPFMLRRTEGVFPPGGFQFTDGVTGKKYLSGGTTFANLLTEIKRDRSANPRLVASPQMLEIPFIAVEVSQQICVKLGNDPRYCSDGSQPSRPASQSQGRIMTSEPKLVEGMACRFCRALTVVQSTCVSCGAKTTFRCTSCRKAWR